MCNHTWCQSLSINIFYFQMHHPVQMKPADSEKRNGEQIIGKLNIFILVSLPIMVPMGRGNSGDIDLRLGISLGLLGHVGN